MLRDVVDGYVSIEAAEREYGVRIRYTGPADALVEDTGHVRAGGGRMRLDGKVAIVTGRGPAGSAAASPSASRARARSVVVNDVDAERAEEVAGAIGERGRGRRRTCPTRPTVDRLFDTALERLGGVDVLVNNAGLIDVERHVLEADEAWWDRVLDVNLKGQFLCALRAAK